jgi:predicted flap endonuclease-1-like 5' DNA nuclease
MPELTVIHFGLFALMLVFGIGGGWLLRADRCAKEKIAVNANWQDQLESRQSEHNRLVEQNKTLMVQINQHQAAQQGYSKRARELSAALGKAISRRDELQHLIKSVRSNLEVAVAQRDRLKTVVQSQDSKSPSSALKDRDDKIFVLSRELSSWQSRVPPLVKKYQERNERLSLLEAELEKAQTRLQQLEEMAASDQTRIEPVDANALPDGGDASNEPIAMTSTYDASALRDQVTEEADDTQAESVSEDSAYATVFANPDVDDDGESSDDNQAELVTENERASNDDSALKHQDANVGKGDDLRMIKGIEPSIEKTLGKLGISRFHQIADMSEYDIDRIAQKLKGFRSRIYREDWIGQARELRSRKNDDVS